MLSQVGELVMSSLEYADVLLAVGLYGLVGRRLFQDIPDSIVTR
jgi:hypothetical protein